MREHPIHFFKANNLDARDEQKYVLEELNKNWDKYNFFVLNCPTGVGKTYIATALASVAGKAYMLTSTLQLQNQYEKSWSPIVNLKGRGNYTCQLNRNFTVDAAPCSAQPDLVKECIQAHRCDYYNQKEKAIQSRAMITNPVYMLYSTHCGFAKDGEDPWVERDVLIIDEAHNMESHLVSFAESDIKLDKWRDDFSLGSYRFTDDISHNYQVLIEVFDEMLKLQESLKAVLDGEFPDTGLMEGGSLTSWARQLSPKVATKVKLLNQRAYALDKAIQPLKIFFNTHGSIEELVKRWIIVKDKFENSVKLAPVYGDFLFKEYLGKLAKKVVFMSATPGDKNAFCKELGIGLDECCYIETDSPFDPKLSPIVLVKNGLKLSKQSYAENIKKIGPIVDKLMDAHPDERGVIHAVTYDIAREIFLQVSPKNKARLLTRDMDILNAPSASVKMVKRVKNEALLERHEQSTNSVLLSPSMMEGVDLKDDLSRFGIIVKLPWPNLGDARVKHKSVLDPDWYTNRLWLSVLQACGRSTRHDADHSVNYIIDENFRYFLGQWQHKLPSWFKNRIIHQPR